LLGSRVSTPDFFELPFGSAQCIYITPLTAAILLLRRLQYLPNHSLYRAFFSKKTPDFSENSGKDAYVLIAANAEKSAGTARPMWNGGRE